MATPPPAPKPKAPARSKAEIAQERLDTAQAVVDRITARIKHHEDTAQDARDELVGATARRDFLALDPALPKGEGATVEAPTATAGSGATAPGEAAPKGVITEKPEHTDPIISGH